MECGAAPRWGGGGEDVRDQRSEVSPFDKLRAGGQSEAEAEQGKRGGEGEPKGGRLKDER
jgi:hypothetical protein